MFLLIKRIQRNNVFSHRKRAQHRRKQVTLSVLHGPWLGVMKRARADRVIILSEANAEILYCWETTGRYMLLNCQLRKLHNGNCQIQSQRLQSLVSSTKSPSIHLCRQRLIISSLMKPMISEHVNRPNGRSDVTSYNKFYWPI